MKIIHIISILILSVGCATTTMTDAPISESKSEEYYEELINKGFQTLSNGNPKESIENYFNPIIEYYENHYENNGKRIYCSRGRTETLYYLLQAANDKQDAIVISQLWADAFYLKGYANFDLGKFEDAKTYIKKALELSPSNSMYLSELGHIYHFERKWSEAADLYKQAEEYANSYSPEQSKNEELTRAMRGIGYSLIELGKLDEAEEKYKKCLEINENDKKALNELKYIQSLRNKNNP
jgi:Flp pilus assembly protein TadD